MSCLWSKGTLVKRSRMCHVFFQIVYAKPTIFPTKRTRLERVLFSTTTVTIPIHPHIWLAKTYFYRRNQQLPPLSMSRRQVLSTFMPRMTMTNHGPWASETDHRTGWNKEFERNVSWHAVLGVCLQTCVNLSLGHKRHYRIDVTASTVEFKTGGLASADPCPGGCKDLSHNGSDAHLIRFDVQDLWYRSEGRTSSATTRPSFTFSSTHGSQEKRRTHAKDNFVLIVELTLTPFRVRPSTLSFGFFEPQ